MDCPIFMLGALRSGTTVFRLILNSHENISNPGENDFIFDYLTKEPNSNTWNYDLKALRQDRVFQSQNLQIPNSADGRQFALKLVGQLQERARGHLCLVVHGNADKVAALFPNSKLIHLIRDPRNVANSCIGMGWAGNTYYGVDPWLETEMNWDVAKTRFNERNIMELKFEDLIADPPAQLQRVCSFIGVPFSPAMLNYSASSTYAPPDRQAVEQWRRKLSPRAVALVEVKARALLLSRGYKLSGYPLDPPGQLERLKLAWDNKAYKWNFSFHRYGAFNFLMEKVTRKLVKPLHPTFVKRMSEIDKQYLK